MKKWIPYALLATILFVACQGAEMPTTTEVPASAEEMFGVEGNEVSGDPGEGITPSPGNVTIKIPDSNLYAALVEVVGHEPIYQTDLENLTYLLGLYDKGITDLTGMEYCVNLREIVLTRNHVTDITPLVGLRNLRYVNLHGNGLTDVAAFASMTQQAELTLVLGDNEVVDMIPLTGLPNLLCVYLDSNNITSVPDLSRMEMLAVMDLRYNQITDAANAERVAATILLDGNPLGGT